MIIPMRYFKSFLFLSLFFATFYLGFQARLLHFSGSGSDLAPARSVSEPLGDEGYIALQLQGRPILRGRDVHDAVSPRVITIEAKDGWGSGFLIGDGRKALSNFHVISGPVPWKRWTLTFFVLKEDGSFEQQTGTGFRLLYADSRADSVVLDTGRRHLRSGIPLVPEDMYRSGDSVYTLGHPDVGEEPLLHTFSHGIISHRRRLFAGIPYIQVDVPINLGNSGGPLLNAHGEAIGIVSMVGAERQGMAFAVTLDRLREPLKKLKIRQEEEKGERDRVGKIALSFLSALREGHLKVAGEHIAPFYGHDMSPEFEMYRDSAWIRWEELEGEGLSKEERHEEVDIFLEEESGDWIQSRYLMRIFGPDSKIDESSIRIYYALCLLGELGERWTSEKIVNVALEGAGAEIRVRLQSKNGSSREHVLRLFRDRDTWCLCPYVLEEQE
ncbi:MAG: trypsin-like peptidase domain-containing protein [Planctomycetota bacterium]|nr:trypsin-like peptidase domain-containing protein [Planctomycetota bacterium]